MDTAELLEELRKKDDNAGYLAREAASSPSLVKDLRSNLDSREPNVKYKSAKVLKVLSSQNPAAVYPYFGFFASLLDSPNNILKWNAIDILANLTAADSLSRFDALFSRYYDLLQEGSLITSGHVVESSPVIAKNQPAREAEITRHLLSVENIPLPTEECRNILRGKVIAAFSQYCQSSSRYEEIVNFVRLQAGNSRSGTQKKAAQFLQKYAPGRQSAQ